MLLTFLEKIFRILELSKVLAHVDILMQFPHFIYKLWCFYKLWGYESLWYQILLNMSNNRSWNIMLELWVYRNIRLSFIDWVYKPYSIFYSFIVVDRTTTILPSATARPLNYRRPPHEHHITVCSANQIFYTNISIHLY